MALERALAENQAKSYFVHGALVEEGRKGGISGNILLAG